MDWVKIESVVQTPMFLAGANQQAAEFRLPSLRGELRYWFRALAAPFLNDDQKRLADEEKRVFGWGEEGTPSAIRFRPGSNPAVSTSNLPDWVKGKKWLQYLLGQGLYSPESKKENRQARLLRQYLECDAAGSFYLDSGGHDTLLACLLWALSVLGGLGARVHRGFGGIWFGDLGQLGRVPEPPKKNNAEGIAEWLKQSLDWCLQTVGEHLEVKVPVINVQRHGQSLFTARHGSSGPLPKFPSFSCWHAKVGTATNRDWSVLLNTVGGKLRSHRAPIDRGPTCDPYRRYVTPEYQNSVTPALPYLKGDDPTSPLARDFALAAFGLPIVFKKDLAMATVLSGDGKELRRASPLWIRPLKTGSEWHILYHVFRADLLGPDHSLCLVNPKDQSRQAQLTTNSDPWDRLQDWMNVAP